jgi:hypothetical protein
MKFEIHFEFRASLRKFQDLNFWDATAAPASSMTTARADTSPPALRAPPFAFGTAAAAVVAAAGATIAIWPSPDPATYQRIN